MRKLLTQRKVDLASVDELTAFLALMDEMDPNRTMTKMAAVFGSDFLVFLDVFAGQDFKVPKSLAVYRLAEKAKMWAERESGASIEQMAQSRNMTPETVGKMCKTVDMALALRERRIRHGRE